MDLLSSYINFDSEFSSRLLDVVESDSQESLLVATDA